MMQQLKWHSLEERRAVSRLTFTYKALHKIIAVNLDHLKTSKSSRSTRLNSSAFTLHKLATKKTLCFQEHHLSGTYYQTMWNHPPHYMLSRPISKTLTSPRLLGTLIYIKKEDARSCTGIGSEVPWHWNLVCCYIDRGHTAIEQSTILFFKSISLLRK